MAYGLTCLTNNYTARYGITRPGKELCRDVQYIFPSACPVRPSIIPAVWPDNLTRCLAEAKPIRQTRASPLREEGRGLAPPRSFFLPSFTEVPRETVWKVPIGLDLEYSE